MCIQFKSIEKIQSILKGHLERVNSLNKINDSQHQEVLAKKPHKSLRGSHESLNSFVRDRDASIERQNHSREFRQRRPSHHSQHFEEQERPQPRSRRQENFKKNFVSDSSDDSSSVSSRNSKVCVFYLIIYNMVKVWLNKSLVKKNNNFFLSL